MERSTDMISQETRSVMDRTENSILFTYRRFPVVFESGKGVTLKDIDGKEYLDFGSGIGVYALGYGNEAYNNALKEQIDRLLHTSNLFYHENLPSAAEKLLKACGLSRVFFTNSGTEAVEGAIKAARKYAWLKDGKNDHEIIAMENSFHGRSVGSLSVTGTKHYREPFEPLMGGVRFAQFNDFDSVMDQVNDRTCAIILETVQGEGGIYPADPVFLKNVRDLCDERDILLILDEIQCGMGRCGSYYAWQNYGVKPDIMTTAKALGGGVPVGAFVLGEKCASSSLEPGDHGTTYGGNPFVCAAVNAVFDEFEKSDLIGHVRETTPYLESKLDELIKRHECLSTRRGMGFMQGVVVKDIPVGKIVSACIENGLVVLSAGSDVIRLLPPLVIGEKEIDDMILILEKVITDFE